MRIHPRYLLAVITGAALALAGSVLVGAVTAGATGTTPKLNGSFVQPALVDSLTDGQLATEDADLVRAGLTQQVLQWTADSKAATTVYPTTLSGYAQSTSTDVLGRTLDAADTAGLTEYVGLALNGDWWNTYANDPAWLDDQATLANQLADEVHDQYGSHPSFRGWYLPLEVDNTDFPTSTTWSAMAGFYTTVADHLHTLTPGLPVIVAPFFDTSRGLTSAQWTSMWEYVLDHAPIDVIALQDGIGDGHATTAELATWYAATATAIANSTPATQLWADTETYDTGFRPLGISTVVADMAAEANYVSNFLSFSYDHYDSPLQVGPLYDTTYRDYLSSGSVEASPPSAPTASATAADALTIDVSWTAATDNVGVAGYHVYRDGTLIDTAAGSSTDFVDTGLDPSTSYTYTVDAFDAASNVSSSSAVVGTTAAAPANGVDLAAGKPYTSTVAPDAAYPDSGGELTDGVHGTASYSDAAWQARSTGDSYSFTIDLGSTHTVKEVDSSWLQARSAAILLPDHLTITTSTNGTTFTAVGTIAAPTVGADDQIRTYRLLYLNVSARYIRVTVNPAADAWSFTDEIEIRSTA